MRLVEARMVIFSPMSIRGDAPWGFQELLAALSGHGIHRILKWSLRGNRGS
jgi:hypothetical protein